MKYLFLSLFLSSYFISFGQSATVKKSIHTPIPADKITMYEVFVRNFSKEGKFKNVTARLKDIRTLGANTIWLMPIQPSGVEKHKGTYGSPYAVKDYAAVNPDFGTKEDFKQLVDSCHALGMNIIIDLVANHTAWDDVWMKDHPNWYTHDSTGKIIPPVADWTDVADLNYDNKDMRKEMLKDIMYWVRDFDIDGYRCDVAGMVPLDFWKDAIDSMNKIKHVVMLAEGDDPKLYSSGFQITYGWDFYGTLKKVFKGEASVDKLDSSLAKENKKFPPNALQLRFITNHDENSWSDVPEKLFGGVDGSKAAFVIQSCIRGVPLIYNGQEVAYPTRINLFEKYEINYNTNPQLKRFYTLILSLHKASPAFHSGSMRPVNVNNKDVYAFVRELGKGKRMLICVNVTNKETKFAKQGIITPDSKFLMGESRHNFPDITLPPYGFLIMKL